MKKICPTDKRLGLWDDLTILGRTFSSRIQESLAAPLQNEMEVTQEELDVIAEDAQKAIDKVTADLRDFRNRMIRSFEPVTEFTEVDADSSSSVGGTPNV